MIRKIIIALLSLSAAVIAVFMVLPFANYDVHLCNTDSGLSVFVGLPGVPLSQFPKRAGPWHPIANAMVITGIHDRITLDYHQSVKGPKPGGMGFRWFGFRFSSDYYPSDGVDREQVMHSLDLPLWSALLATATYPTIALIRGPARRWHRRRRGRCLSCGYNLTGNESGVCPECGTEVETK